MTMKRITPDELGPVKPLGFMEADLERVEEVFGKPTGREKTWYVQFASGIRARVTFRQDEIHVSGADTSVLEEVNSNTKALLQLDAQLLERLTSNSGNLLDDDELVDVLASTKAKAAEVKEKLLAADETKKSISEKREQFRPVATRGSVLYFSIVDSASCCGVAT